MTHQPTSATEPQNEARVTAIQRALTLARQWLADDPEQLLQHFERQAKQLLVLQAELSACQAELEACHLKPYLKKGSDCLSLKAFRYYLTTLVKRLPAISRKQINLS